MDNKQISLEEQKIVQVKILEHIDTFCRSKNIDYSLAFGTLLGAVRHKGYIPWDDDIDIMMTRENYERFRTLYYSERYPLADLKTSTSHPVPMGKIYDSHTYFIYKGYIKRDYGLFVDVFPVDNVPYNQEMRLRWIDTIKKYVNFNTLKNNCFSYIFKTSTPFKSLIKGIIIKSFLPSSIIHNRIELLYTKYNQLQTGYKGVPSFMAMNKGNIDKIFPDVIFADYVTIEFEGKLYQCIKDFDSYLTILYGDYMELPPVEQRVGNHGIIAFYK